VADEAVAAVVAPMQLVAEEFPALLQRQPRP
jgi:hypothetical protein